MRLFQPTYRDRTGATRRAAKRYVEIRNAAGVLRRVPGFTDHKATEALGRQLVRLVNCKGSGQIPDPALVQWLEGLPGRLQTLLARQGFLDGRQSAGMKPLAEHLADYDAYLAAKGNTAEHVEKSCARVRRVVNGCRLAFWSEIAASKVLALLNDLRPDTAAELRAFLAGKMPGAAAFALPNRDRAIRGFKADLTAPPREALAVAVGQDRPAETDPARLARCLALSGGQRRTSANFGERENGATPRDVTPCESTEKTVESGSETPSAGVAELADARDSKSRRVHSRWGFDSPLRHQPNPFRPQRPSPLR
jgi:hypothetical protein